MKIAVVSSICNPKSGARAPIDLALALSKTNSVSFYAFADNKDQDTLQRFHSSGVKVLLFRKSTFPLLGAFRDFWSLYSLLRKNRYDVLSAHTTLSLLLAARLTGIPLVGTYYGTQFDVLNERFIVRNSLVTVLNVIANVIIFIKGFILMWIPDIVIAVSKFTQEEAEKLYKRKCEYIYLGSTPSHWTSTPYPHKSTITTLLSVSRITPYKQFEKIIEAVNHLSRRFDNLRLIIVGSSPQSHYLRYLRSLAQPNTQILTNMPDSELATLYQTCDIYATADKYLFFGMPVLEAAMFGKPTVAFNYAAAKEMVQHEETGFVVNTQTEFEKYLKLLIENTALRNRMGKNAKIWADNFSWEKTAKEYIKVFEELLKIHG